MTPCKLKRVGNLLLSTYILEPRIAYQERNSGLNLWLELSLRRLISSKQVVGTDPCSPRSLSQGHHEEHSPLNCQRRTTAEHLSMAQISVAEQDAPVRREPLCMSATENCETDTGMPFFGNTQHFSGNTQHLSSIKIACPVSHADGYEDHFWRWLQAAAGTVIIYRGGEADGAFGNPPEPQSRGSWDVRECVCGDSRTGRLQSLCKLTALGSCCWAPHAVANLDSTSADRLPPTGAQHALSAMAECHAHRAGPLWPCWNG
jgi:hypothetical protein